MFASEWIFGLFSSVVPTEQMGLFFDKFYIDQWVFFYQFILSILKEHEEDLLQEDDLYSILQQIKPQTNGSTAAAALTSSKIDQNSSCEDMDASQLPAEAQEQQNKQFQISNFFKRLVPWTSKDGQINSVVAG